MNRITLYETNEDGSRRRLGWFDADATLHVLTEDTNWNGENHIGRISGMTIVRAALYRTNHGNGRWVQHLDARREFGGADTWCFLSDDEAREWILRSGGPDAERALAQWFPDTPDDSHSSKGGRPKIGPTINVAYPPDLLHRITKAAAEAGVDRAKWLRDAAEAHLSDGAS